MKLPSLSNFLMDLKPGGLFSVSSSIEENPCCGCIMLNKNTSVTDLVNNNNLGIKKVSLISIEFIFYIVFKTMILFNFINQRINCLIKSYTRKKQICR